MINEKQLKSTNMISYMGLPGLKGETQLPPVARRTAEYIEYLVSEHYQQHMDKLKGPRRHREATFSRQVIMFLTRRYTHLSLKDVGMRFNRDHTTVIHSVRTINNLMDSDPLIRSEIQHFEKKILE